MNKNGQKLRKNWANIENRKLWFIIEPSGKFEKCNIIWANKNTYKTAVNHIKIRFCKKMGLKSNG